MACLHFTSQGLLQSLTPRLLTLSCFSKLTHPKKLLEPVLFRAGEYM